MISTFERYEKDLEALISSGNKLWMALQYECRKDDFEKAVRVKLGKETKKYLESLPGFDNKYQLWYSEAKALIRQLLPDRLDDFVRHYEKPKSRKEISYENYCIEDCLQGLTIRRWDKTVVVGPEGAISHMQQQLAIVESIKPRFVSSLFDIQQLAQADLFDSELEAAKELTKNRFHRAAGALAGVVLERHLGQVLTNHHISMSKKTPTIADLNDALKNASVLDLPTWRFIQHLADIRNLCDHNKEAEPSKEQVYDLISGVAKISKTLH